MFVKCSVRCLARGGRWHRCHFHLVVFSGARPSAGVSRLAFGSSQPGPGGRETDLQGRRGQEASALRLAGRPGGLWEHRPVRLLTPAPAKVLDQSRARNHLSHDRGSSDTLQTREITPDIPQGNICHMEKLPSRPTVAKPPSKSRAGGEGKQAARGLVDRSKRVTCAV